MNRIFRMGFMFILMAISAVPADSADTATVNPGFYGRLGDFHELGSYSSYPSYYDLDYYREHNARWFWLGHQWVVPYLLTDTCKVREGINEFKHKSKIWYEVFWWGNHSVWGGKSHKTVFGLGQLPDSVMKKLQEKGIKPGGGDVYGKTWIDLAANSGNNPLMDNIKKTIAWQLDTIFSYCGKDALYGVMLSEEEPDICLNYNIPRSAAADYNKVTADKREVKAKMTAVMNQLYDFVKSRYPWLKVAPGVYTDWVDTGNLKRDANIMDCYPGAGEEEKAIEKWLKAWGNEEESFVLLDGYGMHDRKIECGRFDKLTSGFMKRGITNIGFFHPKLSLEDKVYRLYDVNGAKGSGPYDVKEHAEYTRALIKETEEIADMLKPLLGNRMPAMPVAPESSLEKKEGIIRIIDAWYGFRERLLDLAYDDLQKLSANQNVGTVADILAAEGFLPDDKRPETVVTVEDIVWLEKQTKEYRQLPDFYKAMVPLEEKLHANMRVVAEGISIGNDDRFTPAVKRSIAQKLKSMSENLRLGSGLEAFETAQALNRDLRAAGVDQSWKLHLVLGNRYGKPLNVNATVSVDYGNGTPLVIGSKSPFIASGAPIVEWTMYLPKRPAALCVATGKWSGLLDVRAIEISNSREKMLPKSFSRADHMKGVEEWIKDNSGSFTLAPWASISSVRIEY
ncbi:MAG: hypothetical protein PHT33_03530 [bacterium]|nr:hypothetical protein [bacterium]